MRRLIIDDEKSLGADRIARDYQEGIKALQEEKWDVLMLDHDLGPGMSGADILKWLVDNPQHRPRRIRLVTNNPAGFRNMLSIIKNNLPDVGYQIDIDWNGFNGPEGECQCWCGRIFTSHTKYVGSLEMLISRKDCPGCGSNRIRGYHSAPERQEII